LNLINRGLAGQANCIDWSGDRHTLAELDNTLLGNCRMGRERTFGQGNRWVTTGEALDEGGQAHIHVVTDSTGQRRGEYVIKLLKNAKRTPRLDKEIETTKRLHAVGCPVLEIVDDYMKSEPAAGRPWYVTPRLVKGALAKHLRSGEHYGGTFESAMQLYRSVLTGVLAIHTHKVAHRDLKPPNILLNRHSVILADLGLALAFGEFEGERLTAELERIGSLHYMPPEAFSRRPINPEQFAFDAFAGQDSLRGSGRGAAASLRVADRPRI
jgi:serine/threonine protein kinase